MSFSRDKNESLLLSRAWTMSLHKIMVIPFDPLFCCAVIEEQTNKSSHLLSRLYVCTALLVWPRIFLNQGIFWNLFLAKIYVIIIYITQTTWKNFFCHLGVISEPSNVNQGPPPLTLYDYGLGFLEGWLL